MCDPSTETTDYTPEQRRLLGKAYRLILSWEREDPKPEAHPSTVKAIPAGHSTMQSHSSDEQRGTSRA